MVGEISTAGIGRLAWPAALLKPIVAQTGFSTGTPPIQLCAATSAACGSLRRTGSSPIGRSTGCCTDCVVRSTQPGRSSCSRPRSTLNVTPVTGRPTSCGSDLSGAISRTHSPGGGSGPATTRSTPFAGGTASASPQTSSRRIFSCSRSMARCVGGSAGSSRAISITDRCGKRSCGSTSGSSRVFIPKGRPSKPNVKLRSPPAACVVVHFQGVSLTASRGRSSSNQTLSSNRSTSRFSSVRSESWRLPSTASAETSATNSTAEVSGASMRRASSATGSGVSIRM